MRTLTVLVLAAMAVGCQRDQAPSPATRDRDIEVERRGELGEEALPLASIAREPVRWSNRKVQGVAEVGVVISDRGFWVRDGDRRVLAVVIDDPEERPIRIRQGQVLRIREAIVRLPEELDDLQGEPVDAETRRMVREQGVFLVIEEEDIELVDRPGA